MVAAGYPTCVFEVSVLGHWDPGMSLEKTLAERGVRVVEVACISSSMQQKQGKHLVTQEMLLQASDTTGLRVLSESFCL